MATTVFPQTDDTVTRTAWQSLNVTINRGDDNGTGTSDTDLLKYKQATGGGIASGVAAIYMLPLSLDAGQTYHVRGCLVMEKTNVQPTDDSCSCGITLGSGMSAWISAHRGNQIVSGATSHTFVDTYSGASNNPLVTIKGTDNVAFANEPALWVDMIVVANEDANVSWYYQKTSDVNNTWYKGDALTWLTATPIKG